MPGFAGGAVVINDDKWGAFASVEVRNASSGDLADISDENGSALTNPFTADEYGVYLFSADGGTYDITATLNGLSTTVQKTIVDQSGSLSAVGSILTPLDSANFVIDGYPIVTVINWVATASGNDSASNASFAVAVSEDSDPHDMYTAASGEFEAIATGEHTLDIDTTDFTLSTTGTSATATIYLQKYVTSWTNAATLASLSATPGSPDSETVTTSETITLSKGEKVRVYYDLSGSAGSDSCAANNCDFTFTYSETE